MIPAFCRQKQMDLYEFKANVFYIPSSRPIKGTHGDLVSKTK